MHCSSRAQLGVAQIAKVLPRSPSDLQTGAKLAQSQTDKDTFIIQCPDKDAKCG